MPDHGPYQTEREARAAAINLASPPPADPLASILVGRQNRQLLAGACEAAGVELGDYDRLILDWLAGWEDATCAVIAGLITRAARSRSAEGGS